MKLKSSLKYKKNELTKFFMFITFYVNVLFSLCLFSRLLALISNYKPISGKVSSLIITKIKVCFHKIN